MFRRRLRVPGEGSGGAGQYRGGLGQTIELGGADGMPVAMLCNFERIHNPARGRDGGKLGAPGGVSLVSGKPIRSKGRQTVQGGDFIRLELPGGVGFGNPARRDPDQVASDVADGLITREMAEADYPRGAWPADGTVDRAAPGHQLRLAAAEIASTRAARRHRRERRRIRGGDWHALGHGLRDHQAVEWIAVVEG